MVSAEFTLREKNAAVSLVYQAGAMVREYALPDDHHAATVAVLRKALELAGGSTNLDRLAHLESEHAQIYGEPVALRRELNG